MEEFDPLENIVYISIPSEAERTIGVFRLDPDIMLPVETSGPVESYDIGSLSWEQIISAMLKILAYRPEHEDVGYYREFILAVKPDLPGELSEAAILQARNQQFEQAEEIFLALHGLMPEETAPLLNLALLYEQRAQQAESRGQLEKQETYLEQAFAYYKSLLAGDEVAPEVDLNAGFFFLQRHNFQRAREHLQRYVDAAPEDGERLEEARKTIAELDAQNLLAELFQQAYDAVQLGREHEAVEKMQRFLERSPEVWRAWFLLGWAHRRLQQYQEAKAAFLRALELGPQKADTLNELAICHMELGEFEAGEKHLRNALQLEHDNTKIISNMGVLALKRGNLDEASRYFETVLTIEPGDPIARRYLRDIDPEAELPPENPVREDDPEDPEYPGGAE